MEKQSSDSLKKEDDPRWYKSLVLHFPIWLVCAFIYFDFVESLPDYEAYFSLGLFVFTTGVWGIAVKIFFFRVPFLGKFIYENNYIIHANIVLILIGIGICMCSIIFGGTAIVNNFIEILFG